MKITKELITVKEYCKKYNITDGGVRKKITNHKLTSLIYEDITYIVIESNEKEKLKSNIKLKNSKIREMEHKIHFYENQKETIIKLENKVLNPEEKLEEQIDKKEELYEKVIGHMTTNNLLERKG